MIKPDALKEGQLIEIVAPASTFKPEQLKAGVSRLEALGFSVKVDQAVYEKKRFFAGSDDQRAKQLIGAFKNPEVKAILCARGGYGSQRIVKKLASDLITANPKVFIGYSDLTILLSFFQEACGMVCVHGPVVAGDLGNHPKQETLDSIKAALTSTSPIEKISGQGIRSLNEFKGKGKLTGGCLSMLVYTIGTPYEIQTDGKVLFLEEINEKPYEIDRSLSYLKTLGKFENIKGVVFGKFLGCTNGEDELTAAQVIEEIIKEIFSDYKIPILLDFPAGHGKEQLCLPFGIEVEVDGASSSMTFLEAALTG